MATDKQARIPGGFGAGMGAALVMMLVMIVLRLTTGALSIPELIIKGLFDPGSNRPIVLFGNDLSAGATTLLMVAIVEFTVLVRGLFGWVFTRFWPVKSKVRGWRWISGLLYGLILGLLHNAIFLPQILMDSTPSNVAGSNSDTPGIPIWIQMFLLSVVFGLALVTLLPWPQDRKKVKNSSLTRSVRQKQLASSKSEHTLRVAHSSPEPERVMTRRDFTKVLAGGAVALAGGAPLVASVKNARAQGSLASRAIHAAQNMGWRQLGVLNTALIPRANFRESDILYNADERMYYVFSTEGDGNPPPPTPIISSTTDTPTTINAPGHHLQVGMQISISGHKNESDDKGSMLNNRAAYNYYRVSAVNIGGNPNTFQLVLWGDPDEAVSSNGGYGGQINYMPDPHVAMRRATTPEGITLASGADYVEYFSSGVWYPTVVKVGARSSSAWHLWGTAQITGTKVPSVRHITYRGDHPVSSLWSEDFTFDPPLLMGDVSVRRNPSDGFWYAVGLYGNTTNDMRIYRIRDVTNGNTWEPVGSVFGSAPPAPPSWATAAMPDPNICFVDGKAFVLFTGSKVAGQWNAGIVEVDIATGKAIEPATMLLQYGAYPSWAPSGLSDLVFVPGGHDGVDRIFAFGGVPYYSGKNAVWGCLDLPAL